LKLLTEHEVAQMYGLKVQTLRSWRYRGKGPAYLKLTSAMVRYREADIEAFLERCRRTSTSAPEAGR
jgi:predicted DNA-binding transcriptional regulator AlpA